MNTDTDPLESLGLTDKERLGIESAVGCFNYANGCLNRAMNVTNPSEQTAMATIAQAYALTGLLGLLNNVVQVVGRKMNDGTF